MLKINNLFWLSLVLFTQLSCQSKKKAIPSFYQDLDVILIPNKSELYSCYKSYIREIKKPNNGDIFIQWKLFGEFARDIYITKSFSEGINICLKSVLRKINFNDLYFENEVRLARYVFSFTDGQLSFKMQSID